MDERCPTPIHYNTGHQHPRERCYDCAHVIAVHGYDGFCDLCALEHRLRAAIPNLPPRFPQLGNRTPQPADNPVDNHDNLAQ